MKKPIWMRLNEETPETAFSDEQIKKQKRQARIIDACLGAASLVLISLALFKQAGYYLVPMFVILLVRSVFWSRAAGSALRAYRQKYRKALREDMAFSVSARWVTWKTLLNFSPFYVFWFAIAFFFSLGGFYAWLFLSVPSVFFAILLLKQTADAWDEMGLSRPAMWGLAFGAYLLCLLPGALMAMILYI